MARKCVSHMLSFLLLAIFINKSFQDSPPRYEPKPSPQSPYGLSCFCLNHIHFKVQATNMFKLFLESYQCTLNLDIYTCSFGQHLVLQTKNCYDPLLKRVFTLLIYTKIESFHQIRDLLINIQISIFCWKNSIYIVA